MPLYLLVLEAHSKAPVYHPLLDYLQRSGAKRLLRTAWTINGVSPEQVHASILMWLPVDDGVVIVPYGEPRYERYVAGERPPDLPPPGEPSVTETPE